MMLCPHCRFAIPNLPEGKRESATSEAISPRRPADVAEGPAAQIAITTGSALPTSLPERELSDTRIATTTIAREVAIFWVCGILGCLSVLGSGFGIGVKSTDGGPTISRMMSEYTLSDVATRRKVEYVAWASIIGVLFFGGSFTFKALEIGDPPRSHRYRRLCLIFLVFSALCFFGFLQGLKLGRTLESSWGFP